MISIKDDLKLIKKYYGENMMHLCRDLFPTLLETDGLLIELMLKTFAPTKFLYNDIIQSNSVKDFQNYIEGLIEKEIQIKKHSLKTPQQLLSDAGYILYVCKSEDDIQKFSKYYALDEKLCTFNGGRLNYCYVFFAVKKNVDEIKRQNFSNPVREDEYGTSVISIQFTKGIPNTLSIKNRYNHTVKNPDATFSNNLENIIPGLTESFEYNYNLQINQNDFKNFKLENYVKASDGRYYKYNYEINNIYYCSDNIIIDNFEVKKYPKEKYIVLDYFVLDLVNKKIDLYDKHVKDCFTNYIKDIKKITIEKKNGIKEIKILTHNKKEIIIKIDKSNKIIGYKNHQINRVQDSFLHFNRILNELDMPNLVTIENNFLDNNKNLEHLNLPKLKKVGDSFLFFNLNLKTFEAPKLEYIGRYFLVNNRKLKSLNLPNLKIVEDTFLKYNKCLEFLNLPNLRKVGDYFIPQNKTLKILDMPYLVEVGNNFMCFESVVETINLPNLVKVGNCFLSSNMEVKVLNLPNLQVVGDEFFLCNEIIEKVNLSNLKQAGNLFLNRNRELIELDLPNLVYVGREFLSENKKIKYVNLPKLIQIGSYFLYFNNQLKILYLPKINDQGKLILSERFKIATSKKELKQILYELKNNKKVEEISNNRVKVKKK